MSAEKESCFAHLFLRHFWQIVSLRICNGDIQWFFSAGYIITHVGGDNFCVSHWIINSNDLFKNTDLFWKQNMIYEWATKLFTQPFSLKNRIIHERNKWLDLWVSHIIIHLTDSFKNTDSFWNETSGSLNVWVTESFTHPVCSKTMNPSGTKQVN